MDLKQPSASPVTWSNFGTIKQDLAPHAVIEVLADLSQTRPTLSRLRLLCLASHDTRFLGALLHLISTPEAQRVLAEWAPDSRHAMGLERLGRACWGEHEAVTALRPFKEDQRVHSKFGKKLDIQYLASMAASRRALPADQTAAWIQRLRIYIVIRAMDALETNVVRESHLLQICRIIRAACEVTGHPNMEWLRSLAGGSLGYQEFVAETTIKCRTALNASTGRTGRNFFESLVFVLERRGWNALTDHQPEESAPVEPYLQRADRNHLAFLAAFKDSGAAAFRSFGDHNEDENFVAGQQRTSTKHSQKKRSQHGDGVRLEQVEKSLFLPHSWHQLSPAEETALYARVQYLLNSPLAADQLGAAITLVSVLCSQTMHDASVLLLKSDASEDWRLDLDSNQLIRLAPRFSRRWRQEKSRTSATHWLHPLASQWTIRLDPKVCKSIRFARSIAVNATNLGDLWNAVGNEPTLAIWFNKHFRSHADLARLTSPCLTNPVGMHVFQQSGDHAMARLVSSDSRTALPSPCAYAAYRAPKILGSLGVVAQSDLAQLTAPIFDEDLNAAGSELDIRLALLRRTIRGLAERVTQSANLTSWLEHHNLLTSLTVLALLASTGARPVNSPFQSFAWIDLGRALLYVEDKNAGPTQGSRVCVLTDYARALLQDYYFPHLQKLAEAFRPRAAAFASQIESVFDPEADARLPLFFFLRDRPALDWYEVSESELERVCQFDWPLPWNFFRHLTSTWLCRWGLHPDIRDALLGHADRDAEPHGHFSTRIPIEDLASARPLINRLTDEVGFVLPGKCPTPAVPTDLGMSQANLENPRLFGRKARALRRQHALDAARERALALIESRLTGRGVNQLSPDEIDAIALAMLFREDGLPHAMGSVRYEVFENYLAQQWRENGQHARVNRRYVLILEGRSLFTEDVTAANRQLALFRASFEKFVAARSMATERPVMAATMAAIDMVLTSKVSNLKALCALLCNHDSIQLVRFDQKYWFEWAYGAMWEDGKPMFRVEITDQAALWISQVLGHRTLLSVPDMPSPMAALLSASTTGAKTLAQLIRQLSAQQAQVNALHMPGIFTAYLGGERPSSALPHADWIRLVKGAAAVLTPEKNSSLTSGDENDLELTEHFFRNHHKRPKNVKGSVLERCKVLFQTIGEALNSDESNPKIASKIARLVQVSGFARGDAPFLLAHFAVHLLKRKPKKGKKDMLRAVTALRYWESLAPAFLDVAADINLTDAEDDELTDLYDRLIRSTDTPEPSQDSESGPGPDEAGKFSNRTDAPLRATTQLRDFHDFVRGTYGLQDPDWAEIAPDISVGVGRPGIVRVQEYLAILTELLDGKAPEQLHQDSLAAVFVLIVCARFGLRIGEAVGLQRSDWMDIAGTLTILVRSNSTRTLKTIRSKRKVPRIETLTPLELSVIDTVLVKWTHREAENQRTPLLAEISRATFKAIKSEIGSKLLGSIKKFTRHEGSTVHMLRHGFAMRVLSLLLCKPLDSTDTVDAQLSEDARRLLTGTPNQDKRLLWAVSRLLGHASPGVTLKSHINCLHMWLEPLLQGDNNEPCLVPPHVINLDRLALSQDYLKSIPSVLPGLDAPLESAFLRCMRTVRLISVGQDEIQAYRNSRLSREDGTSLISGLTRASKRLPLSDKRFGVYSLLYGVTRSRINDLVAFAEEAAALDDEFQFLEDWEFTVGSSRQILLYREIHFEYLALFMKTLKLDKKDIWIVSKTISYPSYAGPVNHAGLVDFVHPKSEVSKTFQLDVAVYGDPPQSSPNRLVAIVGPEGQLKSSYELLVLWVIWNISLKLD